MAKTAAELEKEFSDREARAKELEAQFAQNETPAEPAPREDEETARLRQAQEKIDTLRELRAKLAEEKAGPRHSDPGLFSSITSGFRSGGTYGTSPYVMGATEVGLDKATDQGKEAGSSFQTGMRSEMQALEAAKEHHPVAYGISEGLGGLAADLVTRGAGRGVKYGLPILSGALGGAAPAVAGEDVGAGQTAYDVGKGAVMGALSAAPGIGPLIPAGLGLLEGGTAERSSIITSLLAGLLGRRGAQTHGRRAEAAGGEAATALQEAQAPGRATIEELQRKAQALRDIEAPETAETTRKKELELGAEAQKARLAEEQASLAAQSKARDIATKQAQAEADKAANVRKQLQEELARLDAEELLTQRATGERQAEVTAAQKAAADALAEAQRTGRSIQGEQAQAADTLMRRFDAAARRGQELTPELAELQNRLEGTYTENLAGAAKESDPLAIAARRGAEQVQANLAAEQARQRAAEVEAAPFDVEQRKAEIKAREEAKAKAKKPISSNPEKVKEIAAKMGIEDPNAPIPEAAPSREQIQSILQAARDAVRKGIKIEDLVDNPDLVELARKHEEAGTTRAAAEAAYSDPAEIQKRVDEALGVKRQERASEISGLEAKQKATEAAITPEAIRAKGERVKAGAEPTATEQAAGVAAAISPKLAPLKWVAKLMAGDSRLMQDPNARYALKKKLQEKLEKSGSKYQKLFEAGLSTAGRGRDISDEQDSDRQLARILTLAKKDEELAKQVKAAADEIQDIEEQ